MEPKIFEMDDVITTIEYTIPLTFDSQDIIGCTPSLSGVTIQDVPITVERVEMTLYLEDHDYSDICVQVYLQAHEPLGLQFSDLQESTLLRITRDSQCFLQPGIERYLGNILLENQNILDIGNYVAEYYKDCLELLR